MKVLLINGSPHARGCTATALGVVADVLEQNGIETETIHVGHKDIHGCIGCGKCREPMEQRESSQVSLGLDRVATEEGESQLGKCVFDKDMVTEVAAKFREADGIVIGSPVYFGAVSGTMTSFLNRLFYSVPADVNKKDGRWLFVEQRASTY